MADSLDMKHASYGVESCEALKRQIRTSLRLGPNKRPAVDGLNPSQATPENLEPVVVEMQRATRRMEEVIEEHGEPGDNLLGAWYWSGVDDLKRLRTRVSYYAEALQYARTNLQGKTQRAFIHENIVLPIFYGQRHKNVADPQSPMITTLADFCEPARIYKNYVYAVEENDAHTGLGNFLDILWEPVVDFYDGLKEIATDLGELGSDVYQGVKTVAGAAKKHAFPILLAGAAVLVLSTMNKK